jgi:quinol-cytochrome oxidoreductase complex cytochrome b subunit
MKTGIQSWLDERFGLSSITKFLEEKTVPQHKHSIWYYTGSAILLFFTIQVITGFMLAFYYKPTLEGANESVARIITEVPLGWIIRSVHSWSASFMLAFVFIHLLSTWLAKSYRNPRELTWMSGVFLLVVSLLSGFTGYLLPWDDLSLSATKVGTDIPRSIPLVGVWVTKQHPSCFYFYLSGRSYLSHPETGDEPPPCFRRQEGKGEGDSFLAKLCLPGNDCLASAPWYSLFFGHLFPPFSG